MLVIIAPVAFVATVGLGAGGATGPGPEKGTPVLEGIVKACVEAGEVVGRTGIPGAAPGVGRGTKGEIGGVTLKVKRAFALGSDTNRSGFTGGWPESR